MNYMLSLPSTKNGNDFVFMVIEKFSKMAILEACKKSITTEAIAKLFLGPYSPLSQIKTIGS